jgi:hypothetical protein
LLVTEDFAFKTRSYKAITGNFSFPWGEVLYGIDVFINPQYRGLRLGRRYMMLERTMWTIESKIYHFFGKNSNYGKFKDEISKIYIEK